MLHAGWTHTPSTVVGQMGHHSPTGRTSSTGSYPSCSLPGKGLHQGFYTIVHEHGGVVEELLIAVLLSLDDEGVGHQPVPVVELVELHRNAIPVLELLLEQQLRVKLEAQEVPAEVLDVVLNDNLDGLPWAGGERRKCQWGQCPSTPLPQGTGLGALLTCSAGPP